ncbi:MULTISPECIES: hypothetical protein [Microbacterium]|uniref:hypothetical protein n=1 Tax=Microbacterium TaxID=33882 RepID=UPI00344D50F8
MSDKSQKRRFFARRPITGAALAAIGLAATAFMAPPASASEGTSPAATGPSSPDATEILDQSERIRAELGFPASTDAIARILATEGLTIRSSAAALAPEVNEYGFIGTAAETAEISRRNALVESFESEAPEVLEAPGFAGYYLDNINGGTLVVQFQPGQAPTDLATELRELAISSGSSEEDIAIREVEHSSADLDAAMHAAWDEAQKAGYAPNIASIAEDPLTNSLDITLTDASVGELVQRTLEASGVDASYEVDQEVGDLDCSSRTDCDAPRRGGVGIDRSNAGCTTGWVMVRNGVRGAITAGHCWYGATGTVTSGGETYGSLTSTNALAPGTHADMRWISIPSNAQPWIYANNSAKSNVVKGQSLGAVGSTACQFGRNSATPRCGTISSTNVSHYSATVGGTVYGQSRSTMSGQGGDSGGAVASSTAGTTARGTVSYGGASWVNYSWIGYAGQYNLGTLVTG